MQVKRVSLAEMLAETGTPALGYSQPQKNRILIQDGLPKSVHNEVMAHEWEHMSRGEEGPFAWVPAAIGAVGSIAGGILGSKGAEKAADTSAAASREATAENKRQFNLGLLASLLLNAPAINTGNQARSRYAGLLGLNTPATDYTKMSRYFRG